MTTERATRLAEKWSNGLVCSLREGEAAEYHKMFLDMLRAHGEAEENIPLTLDELREMDGEPVWVTPGNFWALVRVVDKLVILVASDGERAYAGAWIKLMGSIYRRKPGEGK